jgi:hypothetical protein
MIQIHQKKAVPILAAVTLLLALPFSAKAETGGIPL